MSVEPVKRDRRACVTGREMGVRPSEMGVRREAGLDHLRFLGGRMQVTEALPGAESLWGLGSWSYGWWRGCARKEAVFSNHTYYAVLRLFSPNIHLMLS